MDKNFLDTLMKYAKGRGINLKEDKVTSSLNKTEDIQKSSEIEVKKSHDFEQQISVEVIAEPFTPDYHGQYYSDVTIKKGKESFDKAVSEGRLSMNLFHQVDDKEGKHIQLLDNYIVPFDCEVNGQEVKKGSWIGEVKWNSVSLWKMRTEILEDGSTEIAGLSLRGWGKINEALEGEGDV